MSLRRTCHELVVDAVLERARTAEGGDGPGRLQLIVDAGMLKILNSFLKMSDLHAEGVTSMELIERAREPLPALDALYLIDPTVENIDRVLEDFKSEGAPQHRHVHLVFPSMLRSDLMAKLAEGKVLASRVQSFMEIPLSAIILQDRGFHFDMLEQLPGLFPEPDRELLESIGHKLVNVCRCLQATSPTVRHGQSAACKALAEQVQAEVSVCRTQEAPVPCQLLIVDRSVDLASVLIHEYTYEAMAYDLLDGNPLDIDRNVVKLPGSRREMLLSDADPLWEELKHSHLEDLRSTVQAKVAEVSKKHNNTGSMSTSDMLDMLRKSPEERDNMDRLSLHVSLTEQLFSRMQGEKLLTGLGNLEQDVGCGIDRSGKDVKPKNLQEDLVKLLNERSLGLSSESRLRILMMFFACMANISETIRNQLINLAQLLPEDHDVLMEALRTKLLDEPSENRHKHGSGCVHRVSKEQAARFKANARTEGRVQLSRFEPRVKDFVEQLGQDRLSLNEFPSLGGGEITTGGASLRMAAADASPAPVDQWSFAAWPTAGAGNNKAAATEPSKPEEVTQRIVIFILGGITHSELRAVCEARAKLPRGTEVILGGTALLTPRRFMNALRPKDRIGGSRISDPDELDLC